MHYTLCAIVEAEKDDVSSVTKTFSQNPESVINFFTKKLEKPLEKFDKYAGPPKKEYENDDRIKFFAEQYGVDLNDTAQIIHDLQEEFPDGGYGMDEGGLYHISTDNPNGKFDYWNVFHFMPVEGLAEHLEEDRIPHAILLPDLTWMESKKVFFGAQEGSEEEKELNDWIRKIKEILARYPYAIAVLIDCHI